MKTVNVLLSSYNGEKYIEEQILSIINQKDVKVVLHVRDDGSTDSTVRILEKHLKSNNIQKLCRGVNLGYAMSFNTLLEKYDRECDYVAFSDQDDYWRPDKLSSALNMLECSKNRYKLYFSNLDFVNENLEFIKRKKFNNLHRFGSAFTRHNVAGCTMVFNSELANVSIISIPNIKEISHDAWTFIVCNWINGEITHDQNSYIFYRQHSNNVTNARKGLFIRIKREKQNIRRNVTKRYKVCEILLNELKNYGTDENYKIIEKYLAYRRGRISRWSMIFDKRFSFGNVTVDVFTKILMLLKMY